MQKTWLAIFVVFLALAGGAVAYNQNKGGTLPSTPDNGGGVVCTMEAKLCPDGSYVGRTGPHCEFAACPTATSAASTSTVTVEAKINQKIEKLGVTIIPLEVLEDSRCPSDVQCIQAGTVRLKASLAGGLGLGLYNATLTLGKPLTTEAETITLVSVTPGKVSTHQISPTEYVFTFTITKR
jgi:hypothetical protein